MHCPGLGLYHFSLGLLWESAVSDFLTPPKSLPLNQCIIHTVLCVTFVHLFCFETWSYRGNNFPSLTSSYVAFNDVIPYLPLQLLWYHSIVCLCFARPTLAHPLRPFSMLLLCFHRVLCIVPHTLFSYGTPFNMLKYSGYVSMCHRSVSFGRAGV